MKRIKWLVLTTVVLLLVTFLSACSILDFFLKKDEEKVLQTPTSLEYVDGELRWSLVPNADSYIIKYSVNGGEEVSVTSKVNKVTLPDSVLGSVTARVMATSEKNYSDSLFSDKITFACGKLILSESSFSFNEERNVLRWNPSEYADSYSLTVKKGKSVIDERILTSTSYTLQERDSSCRYVFEVIAKSSSGFKQSNAVLFSLQPELDFEGAEEITVDYKTLGTFFEIEIDEEVEYIVVGEFDHTADCLIDNNSVSLPKSLIDELSYGSYKLVIGGDGFDIPYILIITDSRAPSLSVAEDYVLENTSLSAEMELFAYQLKAVSIDSFPLDSSDYNVDGATITIKSDYLDNLSIGKHTWSITLESLIDGTEMDVSDTFTVKEGLMVLNSATYNHKKGNNLALDVHTNGDRVSAIYADGVEIPSFYYSSSKNSVVIFASYLDESTSVSFTISTENGANLTFTLNRNLKGFVPSKTLYTYDKSENSLFLDGYMEYRDANIYGNNITADDFFTSTNGITLLEDYLNTLSVGEYKFLVECCESFSYVNISVTNDSGVIENVRLDFDLYKDQAFLCFDCGCGNDRHYYCLDSGATIHADRTQQLSDFNFNTDHFIKVSCSTYSSSTTISYSKPSSEELSYMNSYFTLKGRSCNKVVGSVKELADVLEYLIYGGSGITYSYGGNSYEYGCATEEVYFTDSFISYIKDNDSYFSEATSLVDNPYSCGYSLKQTSSNLFALMVSYKESTEKTQTSGMEKLSLEDTRELLTEGNRSNSFNGFAINSFLKTELITTTEELANLPYGVRPIFEGESEAKTIYENALAVVRKYISSDYTDIQKVTAIFHWLVTNITYDDNTLELYNLSAYLQSSGVTATKAKDKINQIIADKSSLSTILTPATKLSKIEDIISYVEGITKKMRAFSLEGSMIDNIAVCDGISDAFKLLCQIEGINAIKVSGLGVNNGTGENHAWNKVLIDGEWYVVDATWGRIGAYVSHKYLLVPESEVIHNHIEGILGRADRNYSVVDTLADGTYDYYAETKVYGKSSLISSSAELKSMLKDFIASGDDVLELKLDFNCDESQLKSVMREVYTGKYRYSIAEGYLTIML